MVFAYLILVHKNPSQLSRLINAISGEDIFIFIHVDRKSNIKDFMEVLKPSKHIMFCTRQKQVSWGGFGMIEATLELMNSMFTSNIQPDYVHLISGQDFPLCSNTEILHFFNAHNGKNFLEAHTIPSPSLYEQGLNRINYKWYIEDKGFHRATQLVQLQKKHCIIRPYFSDIQPYNGSQWWSLTGECVRWIYEICKPGYRLYDFYKYTFVPDEMLFQTMLKNNAWNDTIIDDNLRKIDWAIGPEYPRIWRNEDFELLTTSGKLFARKFDERIDCKIIERLENQIIY